MPLDRISCRLVVCCVTNRTPHVDKQEIFGFGVCAEDKHFKTRAEIICVGAFEGGRRVKSTQGDLAISYILPLWVSEDHWAKAKPKLFEECNKMWRANADFCKVKTAVSDSIVTLRVICRILTSMVADEKREGVLTAAKGETSDCFISGYFSVLRLLKQLSVEHSDIVDYANTTWEQFVNHKSSRLKTSCPNIGDLLPLLCVSSHVGLQTIDWNFVKRAYVDEANLRNVMWSVALP